MFFGGGLAVSVKIGGGTNLHNLDAYMVLLLVATAELGFGRFAPPKGGKAAKPLVVPWGMLFNFVVAGFVRTIEWSGVRYRLRSDHEVEILGRESC